MTTISIFKDAALGTEYAVELSPEGTPLQAMRINGPRDEEWVLSHTEFNDSLSQILDEPRRYVKTSRTLVRPTTAAPAAAAAPVDEWTKDATHQRMATLNRIAGMPGYKSPDGKYDFAKLEAACGFSLKALQAARKRHVL